MLGLSEGKWKLQLLSYTEVKHSSSPPPPPENKQTKKHKHAIYRSKHEPLVKLPWNTYILKQDQRGTSGSGTPATAAPSLSTLQSCRTQAAWDRPPKEEGAGQASSPMQQQKAVKRQRILERRL